MSTRERFPAPIDVHSYLIDIEVKRHIYLETGLLDMLNIAPLNQSTFQPADLIHNAADAAGPYNGDMGFFIIPEADPVTGIANDNAGLPEEPIDLEDRNDSTDNNGRSKSGVGCDLEEQDDPRDNDFRTELSIYNPLTDTTFHFGPPDGPWCKDAGVFFRKYCQVRAPASQWTGLMQKFVQSLYGSDRRDYDYDLGLDLHIIDMFDEPLGFSPYWEATAGIFTDGNFNYWIIRPQSNGVFARLLRPVTGAGKALQKRLKEQGATGREEYYLLSTLRQSNRFVKIGDAATAYDFGVPWWYGWHYNEDGSQADVICINPFSNGSTTNPRHESAHFRMSITYNPPQGAENGPINEDNEEVWFDGFTVTVATVESPQEFTHRNNKDLVWFPLLGADGSEVFVPKPNFGSGDDIDCDVPMYCFRDQGDLLQVVRFQRATDPEPYSKNERTNLDGSISTIDVNDPLNFSTTCKGVYGYAVKETSNASFLYGFYIPGGHDARTREINGLTLSGATEGFVTGGPTLGTWFGVSGSISFDKQCNGIPSYENQIDEAAIEFYPISGGQLGVSTDLLCETLMAIPWFDASSVYIGHKRGWAGQPVHGGILDGVGPPNAKGADASAKYRNLTTGEEFGGGGATRWALEWLRPFAPHEADFKNDPEQGEPDNFLETSGQIDFDAIQMWWVYRNGVERVHESASGGDSVTNLYIPSKSALSAPDVGPNVTGLDPTFDWGGWSGFFNPLMLISPFVTQFIPALQSQRGSYLAYTSPEGGGPITEGYDFGPVSTTFSFVGEA